MKSQFKFVELIKSGSNRTNFFTGASLMEMFPVCEITRSQGIERVIYNHGVLSCKSPPAMARQR